ncbi:MAG: serine protease, partial [Kiritimatiellales bacterium]|nr:serine protease [Kiritimatiellales bacterium]
NITRKLWIASLACMLPFSRSRGEDKKPSTTIYEEFIKKMNEEKERTKKEKEDLEKKHDMERARKREEEHCIKKLFSYSVDDVADKLVIIQHDSGAGSGFIVNTGGKRYILTNQHVILGFSRVSFKTLNGEQLRPQMVELSASRDLARLLLEEGSGLEVASSIEMDSPIAVFGNSEGAGVATGLYGTVAGIGADVVEVTAEFVKGNSGSAVMNLERKVIGAASYIKLPRKTSDTKGTRFENQTRRFCVRITGARWMPVNWKKYNESWGKTFRESNEFMDDVLFVLSGMNQFPPQALSCRKGADRTLGKCVDKYNEAIQHFSFFGGEKNRRFLFKFSDSLENLSAVCRSHAKMLMYSIGKRDLEDFVLKKIKNNAEQLESIAEFLDQRAEQI